MTRKTIFFLTALSLMASLVSWPAVAEDLKYFEIVREKPDCTDGACFIEYLFLSSGLSIKKQYYSKDYEKPPVMSIRQAQEPQVQALFAEASGLFAPGKNLGNSAREKNNLYLYDGSALFTYGAQEPPSPAFQSLFDDAGAAFSKAAVTPEFYIHEYYELASGGMEDFHIFSNGSVIFSIFAKPDYSLVSTGPLRAEPEDMSSLRELAGNALRSESKRMKRCPKETGLGYGFMEMQINGAFLHTYTCGDGGDAASALFNRVRLLRRGAR